MENITVKYLRSLGLDVMNNELKGLNLLNRDTINFDYGELAKK
jgi:hypothetical protein